VNPGVAFLVVSSKSDHVKESVTAQLRATQEPPHGLMKTRVQDRIDVFGLEQSVALPGGGFGTYTIDTEEGGICGLEKPIRFGAFAVVAHGHLAR